jgi:hypothetical protein
LKLGGAYAYIAGTAKAKKSMYFERLSML